MPGKRLSFHILIREAHTPHPQLILFQCEVLSSRSSGDTRNKTPRLYSSLSITKWRRELRARWISIETDTVGIRIAVSGETGLTEILLRETQEIVPAHFDDRHDAEFGVSVSDDPKTEKTGYDFAFFTHKK